LVERDINDDWSQSGFVETCADVRKRYP